MQSIELRNEHVFAIQKPRGGVRMRKLWAVMLAQIRFMYFIINPRLGLFMPSHSEHDLFPILGVSVLPLFVRYRSFEEEKSLRFLYLLF